MIIFTNFTNKKLCVCLEITTFLPLLVIGFGATPKTPHFSVDRFRGGHPKDHKEKERFPRTLLFRALGGLWGEGRHGKKAKKFWKFFCQILMVNISASEPRIEKTLKLFEETGYHIISKQFGYF